MAVLPERYAHSIAALGFPGFRRAFQAGHGSQLGAGDAAFTWTLEGADSATTSPVYFEADGVPVAHWWITTASDSAHFEAAVAPVPGITDTLLVASVRVTVSARAGGVPGAALRLRVLDELDGPHWRPWDAVPAPGAAWSWESGRATRDGRVLGGLSDARAWRVAGGERGERLAAEAPAGATTLECWLADRPLPPTEADRIERRLRHDDHVARTRTLWRDWLARGATFETPDTLVNMAWRAALVTLLQGHERSAGGWVPLGNPFQYRDTWLRDGARVVRALALAGQGELARADALTFTRYQLPSGALVSQPGQLDGTGQALWAFEQAASLPPDPAWARRDLAVAVRGGAWLRAQRARTIELSTKMRVDWPGLLPFGDPRDAELVRGPLVGNDAWAIAGQEALAALAARAGDEPASEAARAEAAAHRAAFGAALERAGHPDVPPSWGEGGRDWGNCYVGFPSRVLAPGDARLAALARRLWARSGLHMVSYGPADSLHTYLGTDLAVWALLADRPADARASLADLLAHSSATLGQAEIFSRSGRGFGGNLPPHGTAAAQLVELLRDLVVMDVRDTLEIAAGADAAWWAGTHLRSAPTRFGTLDLSLSHPAADRFEAKWAGSGAARSAGVPVRVRVPDGFTLVRAVGGAADPADARWVACPATATGVTLFVKEAP
ncbi:MAG: hypothetical protein HZA61_01405 [Candidatus Eisenbacteria bacterium]|uniref:Uncharacterized protein n=1 Tax=Eiseniibacteriota bacterium TaxID=2212470 RepID=A0A933SAC1_UNCEI|nr:hypothetical protein [Candidatus Eisenbacteria bacterium]